MTDKRCGSCKHWCENVGPLANRYPRQTPNESFCLARAHLGNDRPYVRAWTERLTDEQNEQFQELLTSADFGCVLWEAKP